MNEQEIVNAFVQALEEHDLARPMHKDDHEFIKMLRDREKRRVERMEKFRMSMIGAFGIAAVSGLVWLGKFIIEHLLEKTH